MESAVLERASVLTHAKCLFIRSIAESARGYVQFACQHIEHKVGSRQFSKYVTYFVTVLLKEMTVFLNRTHFCRLFNET